MLIVILLFVAMIASHLDVVPFWDARPISLVPRDLFVLNYMAVHGTVVAALCAAWIRVSGLTANRIELAAAGRLSALTLSGSCTS